VVVVVNGGGEGVGGSMVVEEMLEGRQDLSMIPIIILTITSFSPQPSSSSSMPL